MKRIRLVALVGVLTPPLVLAGAGNIPGHGGGGPGDQETEQLGGLHFYAGATYNWMQLHIDDVPQEHYNLQFADVRAGYKLFKSLGFEVHAGVPTRGTDDVPGRARLNRYEGVFVVPTAVVFDTFEIGFPIGYNWSAATVLSPGPVSDKRSINSVAFGANAEFPIRVINGDLPDIRLVARGMAFSVHSGRQAYGFGAGLRYDFDLGNAPPPPPVEGAAAPDSGSGSGGESAAPAADSGAAPASGGSSGAAAPASGASSGAAAPASGASSGAAAPASGGSSGAAAPAAGSSSGTPSPAP